MNKNELVENYGQDPVQNKEESACSKQIKRIPNSMKRNTPANNFDEVPIKGQQAM